MKSKLLLIAVSALLWSSSVLAQSGNVITGKVVNEYNNPLEGVTVSLLDSDQSVKTKADGTFELFGLRRGRQNFNFSLIGYKQVTITKNISRRKEFLGEIVLISRDQELEEVEVFGDRNRQPKGLEGITRMPLKPSDQIQSISIISSKVIEEQGALTLTDAVRNVPGVTLFGSYGGVKESMSTRGFRGIPVLKNGVRMDSQFQTASGIADMQGAESIQVIKGSAAITQGVITDIGNAGGVINVVTKTPDFVDATAISMRIGSWGQFRPTFDYQTVLNTNRTLAFRLNGAYERADSYRSIVNSNRVYLNPSLVWKPDEKTTIIFEGDYMNDNRTPMNSALNMAEIDQEALYLLPYDKFLGFKDDNTNTKMSSYMARFERGLNELFKLRLSYAKSSYEVDNISTAATVAVDNNYDLRRRVMSRSLRDDKNSTLQLDLIGQDVYTGTLKHTMQVGVDYRIADATTTSLGSRIVDTINIKQDFSNILTSKVDFTAADPVLAYYSTFGIMAQDVVTFNKYVKAILGLRYTEIINKDLKGTGVVPGSAWNPSIGVMLSPIEQVNLFGSYTNSTSLRSAANMMNNGERIGPSSTEQFEFGVKSDWLNNKLRFNLTYFHINTGNLSNAEYIEGTNTTTGYYFKAGDLKRDGVEAELSGRIMDNLTVMLGYAYLNARYDNSPSYVNGSAPMNAPKNTANAWLQYKFVDPTLTGLSIGLGMYYVGERPVNEYSLSPDGHGSSLGIKPFDMPAYTTLNAQVAYAYKKVTARVFLNNIADEIGFNSYYRGGFINQTDPRNAAVTLSYRF